jgi:anti-sigma B factor antagonist
MTTAPSIERSTLGLQVLDCGGSALISVSGELDVATSGLLHALLDDVLRARRRPRLSRLVLDLRELSFVDACGVAPVLHARAVLARRGGTLELRRPSRAVRRVLQLLDLHEHMLGEEPRRLR